MGVVTETGVETIFVASVVDADLVSSTLVDADLDLVTTKHLSVQVTSPMLVWQGV